MSKLISAYTSHAARRLRGLWLILAFIFLTVQLGLPAHEAGHPIGQADTACHFCMLGGHAPAMSNAVLPLKLSPSKAEAPRLLAERSVLQTLVRTRYSRGPPQAIDA